MGHLPNYPSETAYYQRMNRLGIGYASPGHSDDYGLRRTYPGGYGSVNELGSPNDPYLASPQSSRGSITLSRPYDEHHFLSSRRFSHVSSVSNDLCDETAGITLYPTETTVYDYEFDDESIDFYLHGSQYSPEAGTPRGGNPNSIRLPGEHPSPGISLGVSSDEQHRSRDISHVTKTHTDDLRYDQSSALEAQTGPFDAGLVSSAASSTPGSLSKTHSPEDNAYIHYPVPEPRSVRRKSGLDCDQALGPHTPLASPSYSRPGEQSNHRDHPYYHIRTEFDGHYHCPFRRDGLCHHRPTRLKCNYE